MVGHIWQLFLLVPLLFSSANHFWGMSMYRGLPGMVFPTPHGCLLTVSSLCCGDDFCYATLKHKRCLATHACQEFIIARGAFHATEQKLHGIDDIEWMQQLT